MKNRKEMVLFALMVFIMISMIIPMIPLTSAAYSSSTGTFDFVRRGGEQFIDLITNFGEPLFNAILGEYTGGYGNFSESEIFFMRILLFILLFVLINTITKKIPKIGENKFVVLIIAFVASVLAVRFMSASELVFGVLLPYGAMGVAITTILPFLIFFYFLHVTNVGSAGRRLSWIFFGIVFVALWISKQDQMPEISNYIYLASIGAIVLAFAFDREIHRYFALHELNVFIGKANQKAVAALQAEYMNIIHVDTPQAKARRGDIENQLKQMGASLP